MAGVTPASVTLILIIGASALIIGAPAPVAPSGAPMPAPSSHEPAPGASGSPRFPPPAPTIGHVVANISLSSGPDAVAYDSSNGFVYVTTDQIAVINGTSVLTNVPVGSGPNGVAFDSQNGYVYASNENDNNVSVINGTSVLANFGVGSAPVGVGFDSGNGLVYVANSLSHNVSVVNGTSVTANVRAGSGPYGIGYDGGSGLIYVANTFGSNVTVLNGTSVAGAVGVGSSPTGVAYDSLNGYVYVTNQGTNNVSVINGTSVVATLGVGSIPWGVAYDHADGFVYVANYGSGNVTVINGTSVVGSIGVGTHAEGIAYDSGSGDLYVANGASSNVTVISTPFTVGSAYTETFRETGLPSATKWSVTMGGATITSTSTSLWFRLPDGRYPFVVWSVTGYVPTPGSGTVTVQGGPVNVSIAFANLTGAAFVESGLPTGTTWAVSLNGTANTSTTNEIAFLEPNGSYPYVVAAVPGFSASPSSGLVQVAGHFTMVAVNFSPVESVTFAEEGLATGTPWTVVLNGAAGNSTRATLVFSVTNGSYPFQVGAVAGYTASPPFGQIVVSGRPVAQTIIFTAVTYPLTFLESGLPSGTLWLVNLVDSANTSTTNSIGFEEPNGSYLFTVSPVAGFVVSPSAGEATVSGTPVTISLSFVPFTAAVLFTEKGLPSGTEWSATLGGASNSSTTGTIGFVVPNGTYAYTIRGVAGYTGSPATGNVTVAGSPRSIAISFAPALFTVSFVASGLPAATVWTVTLNGSPRDSSGPDVNFSEVDGTYSFTVGAVSGYTPSPSTGSLTVNGPTSQPIRFSANGSTSGAGPSPATLLGLPTADTAALLGGVAVVVIAVGAVLVILRRRGGPGSSRITPETFEDGAETPAQDVEPGEPVGPPL